MASIKVEFDNHLFTFDGAVEAFHSVRTRQQTLEKRLLDVLWTLYDLTHPLASGDELVGFLLRAAKHDFNVPSSTDEIEKAALVAEAKDLVHQIHETHTMLDTLRFAQQERKH